MSKTSCPWYRNLIVYSVMHLKLKHVLSAFLSFYRLNAIQMHKCKFLCPKCISKGSYSYANVDLGPYSFP